MSSCGVALSSGIDIGKSVFARYFLRLYIYRYGQTCDMMTCIAIMCEKEAVTYVICEPWDIPEVPPITSPVLAQFFLKKFFC